MDSLALSSSKDTRDIQGGPKLSGIKAKVEGAAFSLTEVLAEAIVPLLRPLPTESASGQHI